MRFAFGKNWQAFLRHLSDARVHAARESLKELLMIHGLRGKRVLDAGCGSGLFSLAAIQLGAAEVVSFDFDTDSVECARSLRTRFWPHDNWIVMQGSILDRDWLSALGKFDVVYSWGVLHHTGQMWAAFNNIACVVKNGGILCVSIYNDQGKISEFWTLAKKCYNASPRWLRSTMVIGYLIPASLFLAVKGLVRQKPSREWLPTVSDRGMHYYNDAVDWLGGYPFEVAEPQAVVEHLRDRGFSLIKLRAKSGSGCNEFVFRRD